MACLFTQIKYEAMQIVPVLMRIAWRNWSLLTCMYNIISYRFNDTMDMYMDMYHASFHIRCEMRTVRGAGDIIRFRKKKTCEFGMRWKACKQNMKNKANYSLCEFLIHFVPIIKH